MSEQEKQKRVVTKSLTVNLYDDGAVSIQSVEATAHREIIGLLHTALGIAMRRALSETADGSGKPKITVPKLTLRKG